MLRRARAVLSGQRAAAIAHSSRAAEPDIFSVSRTACTAGAHEVSVPHSRKKSLESLVQPWRLRLTSSQAAGRPAGLEHVRSVGNQSGIARVEGARHCFQSDMLECMARHHTLLHCSQHSFSNVDMALAQQDIVSEPGMMEQLHYRRRQQVRFEVRSSPARSTCSHCAGAAGGMLLMRAPATRGSTQAAA